MYKLQIYDRYDRYDIYDSNKNVCGEMATHNNQIVHFEITIEIKDYFYRIYYIKYDNRLSIDFHKVKSPKIHTWSNQFPLKCIEKSIRERLIGLLEELDYTFEPFVICKEIMKNYFKRSIIWEKIMFGKILKGINMS